MKLTSVQFKTLRKASEGVTRVTQQMINLVYDIAYEISDLGKPNDFVIVAGETLRIARIQVPAKDSVYNYLLLQDGQNYLCLFDSKQEKLGSEYLSDSGYLEDSNTYCPPTREQKIFFLQNVTEIITAFTTLWQEQERKITDLLERVKLAICKIGEDPKQ